MTNRGSAESGDRDHGGAGNEQNDGLCTRLAQLAQRLVDLRGVPGERGLLVGAAWALWAAAAILGARGLVALFRRLPEREQGAFFSRPAMMSAALRSVVPATLLSCVYWYVFVTPMPPLLRPLLMRHWHKLDLVPSLFAQLLPPEAQSGFHQYFRFATHCFPGPLAWETTRYLRTAIPGWSLLFFLLILGLRLVKKRARPNL